MSDRDNAPRDSDGTYSAVTDYWSGDLECWRCEEPIGPDDKVWRTWRSEPAFIGWAARLVVLGPCCRPDETGDPLSRVKYWETTYEHTECDGCGRPMARQRDRKHRKYDWCSNACRRNNSARVRRERARTDLTCQQCHESFDADRSDAKYCSNACRQKAYRQRKKED